MARRYFRSVQVRQQVQLHAVLQHFSFCTKPFFSCYRLLLTMAKIQISRWSNSLSHTELKSTPLGQDGGYLVRQNHSGHRVCAGMFYILSCNLWLYENIERCKRSIHFKRWKLFMYRREKKQQLISTLACMTVWQIHGLFLVQRTVSE